MKNKFVFAGAILSSVLLYGCANNFEKFYHGVNPQYVKDTFETSEKVNTKLYVSNFANLENDERELMSDNYVKLGVSSFFSPEVSIAQALSFGNNLYADIVMVYTRHKDTVNMTTPIVTPTFTSVNTSYYNNYGGWGQANSTINGTRTTYVSNAIDRFEYFATYWKLNPKKPRVGVFLQDLTDDIRQQIGTNKGVIVAVVNKNSLAFKNDIIVGDIITTINGNEVYDTNSYKTLMDAIPDNSDVEYIIIRNGKTIKKKFKI